MGRSVFLCAFMALVASPAGALPACAPPVEISDLAITRIEQNGVLVATDGRAVKMEGIRLPAGAQDRAPQSWSDAALSALHDLAYGHLVTVTAKPPKQDRYDRVRGQIFATEDGEVWLQLALLRKGLARVSFSPDRRECVKELYAAEADARARRAGIWAAPAYAVRQSANVSAGDLGTFQIVEGKVVNASVKSRAYLNFGADWKRDFTATIAPEDMKTFRAANIDPARYAGKTIRVRGIVEWHGGPEIEIASPDDIEVLPDLRPAQR
ncbi:MAG TPA: thermonuclease family protein [Rhizomicrobium sp.]|jgi:endonuclease YncB( thermonuclease family)